MWFKGLQKCRRLKRFEKYCLLLLRQDIVLHENRCQQQFFLDYQLWSLQVCDHLSYKDAQYLIWKSLQIFNVRESSQERSSAYQDFFVCSKWLCLPRYACLVSVYKRRAADVNVFSSNIFSCLISIQSLIWLWLEILVLNYE